MKLLDTITLGDCLDILPSIPDASVDMILSDLPYAVTEAHWDHLIPMERLWTEYHRVIKPHGAIVLTAVQPFTSLLIASNLAHYRYSWVWDKGRVTGFLNAKRRPLRQHEDIVVFAAQTPVYYPVTVSHAKVRTHKRQGGCELYGAFTRLGGEYTFRYPTSILYVPQNTEEHRHPTQKPVALFEYLIKTYTQPGEVVLDSCAGSGTTAIAAYTTQRHFICLEKDADYHAQSLARLERQCAMPTLF